MVKLILLFSSEIWRYDSKEDSRETEKTFSRFCKHILEVHRNTTSLAIYGEFGVHSLHIDIKTKMILYNLYLKNQENKLFTGALAEFQKLNQTGNSSHSWLKNNEEVISENKLL